MHRAPRPNDARRSSRRPGHAAFAIVAAATACGPTAAVEANGSGSATGGNTSAASGTSIDSAPSTDSMASGDAGDDGCGAPPPPEDDPPQIMEGGVLLDGCDNAGLLGSPEGFATTPRADTNIEALALRVGGTFFADDDLYARLRDDIYAIRCEFPELADVRYRPYVWGNSLIVRFGDATFPSVVSGDYDAWDCLNAWYGFELSGTSSLTFSAFLESQGIFATDQVTAAYDALPGVLSAVPDGNAFDASTICVVREGETFRYRFDVKGGDCPSGCTTLHSYHFVVEVPGQPTAAGDFDADDVDAFPDWFGDFQPC